MRDELRLVLHKQGHGTVGEHVGVSMLRSPSQPRSSRSPAEVILHA